MNRVTAFAFGLILICSSASASTFQPDIEKGQVSIGYTLHSYDRTSSSDGNMGGGWKFSEYSTLVGMDKNLSLYVNYADGQKRWTSYSIDNKYVDFGVQYALNPNFALLIGQRNQDERQVSATDSTNDPLHKMTYGAVGKIDLTNKLDGYVTYQKSSNVTDYVMGLSYTIQKNTFVDINYKRSQTAADATVTLEGFGAGVSFKF